MRKSKKRKTKPPEFDPVATIQEYDEKQEEKETVRGIIAKYLGETPVKAQTSRRHNRLTQSIDVHTRRMGGLNTSLP